MEKNTLSIVEEKELYNRTQNIVKKAQTNKEQNDIVEEMLEQNQEPPIEIYISDSKDSKFVSVDPGDIEIYEEISRQNKPCYTKNPDFLYEDDNPALFRAIKKALNMNVDSQPLGYVDFLTKTQLKNVEFLNIEQNIRGASLTSLKGIEKLTYLKSLSIEAFSYKCVSSWIDEEVKKIKEKYGDSPELQEKIEQKIKGTANVEEHNQIKDFSSLYACKTLEKIDLSYQRNLSEFDAQYFPKLKRLKLVDCEHLVSLHGLSELNVFKEDMGVLRRKEKVDINLSDCNSLKDISDIGKLSLRLEKGEFSKDKYRINIPTTTFCHLSHQYEESMKLLAEISKNDNDRDIFEWTEHWHYNQKSAINTRQMQILRKKINEIVSTINADIEDTSEMSKISNAYRWVCDNLSYDNYYLQRAIDEKKELLEKEVKIDKLTYEKPVSDYVYGKISSSFVSILRGEGICVGIGNAYNLLLAEMGFIALPCICSVGKKEDSIPKRAVRGNHNISKITILVDKKPYTYYFDPTWDCGSSNKGESNYFALSMEEMERNHQFTLADDHVQKAPSIQGYLRQRDYLVSRYNGHEKAREKNIAKHQESKRKKEEYLNSKEIQ